MKKVCRVSGIFMICVCVIVFLNLTNLAWGELQIEIDYIDPDVVQAQNSLVELGSIEEITFGASVNDPAVKMKWEILPGDVGYFAGGDEDLSCIYVLPNSLLSSSQKLTIRVTARAEYGEIATDSVSFTLRAMKLPDTLTPTPTLPPTVTPTPMPTLPPEPTKTPTPTTTPVPTATSTPKPTATPVPTATPRPTTTPTARPRPTTTPTTTPRPTTTPTTTPRPTTTPVPPVRLRTPPVYIPEWQAGECPETKLGIEALIQQELPIDLRSYKALKEEEEKGAFVNEEMIDVLEKILCDLVAVEKLLQENYDASRDSAIRDRIEKTRKTRQQYEQELLSRRRQYQSLIMRPDPTEEC